MKKLLSIILFVITNFSFSQTEKNDYEIFTTILNQELNIKNKDEFKSVIITRQFENRSNRMSDIDYIFKDTTFKNYETQYIFDRSDTTFVKRYIKEPNLKLVILGLINNFNNHPIINGNLFKKNLVPIKVIDSKKYYSFFKRKGKNGIDKGWKKIKKKYKTRFVYEFSTIYYKENLATIYFEKHCGGLCGNGNFVVLEKINGEWKIIANINLWVS